MFLRRQGQRKKVQATEDKREPFTVSSGIVGAQFHPWRPSAESSISSGASENVLSSVEVVEPLGWGNGWKNFVNKTQSQQEGSGLIRTKCPGRERQRKRGTEGLSSSLN